MTDPSNAVITLPYQLLITMKKPDWSPLNIK